MAETTVVAAFVAHFARVAEMYGIPRTELYARTGLTEAALADPDSRIPFGQLMAIWDLLSERDGFDRLGVTLGMMPAHTEMGVLGWMFAQCATLRDAATAMHRYGKLLSEIITPRFEADGKHAVWTQILEPRYVRLRQPQEWAITSHVATCRALTGVDWPVRFADVQHSPPVGEDRLSATLGVEVRYGAPAARLGLDLECFDAKVRTANPAMLGYLERLADVRLAQLPRESSNTTDRVRKQLATTLAREVPTQSGIARALAMSERTLQRRLAEESTTFAELLDETRRELAVLHLHEGTLAVYEIALLLGYNDPSAFHRAFRRWTGRTPRAFRDAAA